MIKFDSQKLDEIKSDFSIFHPTPTQVEIIFDFADQASQYIKIDKDIIRLIIIKSQVDIQKEFSTHQFEIEESPMQTRMKYAQRILQTVEDYLIDMLVDENDIDRVKAIVDKIFKYYTSKYAGR